MNYYRATAFSVDWNIRKISSRIIIGKRVENSISKACYDSMLSLIRNADSDLLLLENLRRNNYLPSNIFPTAIKTKYKGEYKEIIALIHLSEVPHIGKKMIVSGIYNREKEVNFYLESPINFYAANSRKLIYASPTLRSISDQILEAGHVETISWLDANRSEIEKECGLGHLSLSYLVSSLSGCGFAIVDVQSLNRLASDFEIYKRSKILQDAPPHLFDDAVKIVAWLDGKRQEIESEIKGELALVTLVSALQAANKVPNVQNYNRLAGGLDLFLSSKILQNIPQTILRSEIDLVNWLDVNRELIKEEIGSESISLNTLMQSLQAAQKVCYDQKYNRIASGLDLYKKSITLQNIPEIILRDPIKVVAWANENCEQIKTEAKSRSLGLVSIIEALQANKKITKEQIYHRLAGAIEIYKRSKTLENIPNEMLNDPIPIIIWLRENRSLIKNESKSRHIAFTTLITALYAAQRIPADRFRFKFEAGAADYAEEFKEKILAEMRNAVIEFRRKNINLAVFNIWDKKWHKNIERSIFLNKTNGNQLGNQYIAMIIKWAIRFYGNEILK